MDFNDYFDPVTLEKPEGINIEDDSLFSHQLTIHTASNRLSGLGGNRIALIGVCEQRNSPNKGSSLAPDAVRNELYQLQCVTDKLSIIDLGNLKMGGSPSDTYYALRDVTAELLDLGIVPIVIGGSQDINYGLYQGAFLQLGRVNLVNIDSRLNTTLTESNSTINSTNWLSHLFFKVPEKAPYDYVQLASQAYFVNSLIVDKINELNHTLIRLGELRYQLSDCEPYLRNADMVSANIGSVRHSDAPGQLRASANGLMGEEFCQLVRYAGLSKKTRIFSICEINPTLDINNVTARLGAQAIWYFIDGFGSRMLETPNDSPDFKRYYIQNTMLDHDIVFVQSNHTKLWWMDVPMLKEGKVIDYYTLASCESEYQKACNGEIPERWWKFFQKVN